MVQILFSLIFVIRRIAITGLLLLSALLVSCSNVSETPVPTLYPTEYIPTVIAMTLEAQGIDLKPDDQPTESPTELPSPTPTEQPTQISLPDPTQALPTPVPEGTPSPPRRSGTNPNWRHPDLHQPDPQPRIRLEGNFTLHDAGCC